VIRIPELPLPLDSDSLGVRRRSSAIEDRRRRSVGVTVFKRSYGRAQESSCDPVVYIIDLRARDEASILGAFCIGPHCAGRAGPRVPPGRTRTGGIK